MERGWTNLRCGDSQLFRHRCVLLAREAVEHRVAGVGGARGLERAQGGGGGVEPNEGSALALPWPMVDGETG